MSWNPNHFYIGASLWDLCPSTWQVRWVVVITWWPASRTSPHFFAGGFALWIHIRRLCEFSIPDTKIIRIDWSFGITATTLNPWITGHFPGLQRLQRCHVGSAPATSRPGHAATSAQPERSASAAMGDDVCGAAAAQLARKSRGIPGALDGADAETTASWDFKWFLLIAFWWCLMVFACFQTTPTLFLWEFMVSFSFNLSFSWKKWPF